MYENEDYEVIDLREILQILLKRIKLIIIVPIIFAVIGALVSIYLIHPVYESSTTLIVRSNKNTDEEISKTDVDLSKSLIYTYAEMAKSNTVVENTKETLKLTDMDRDLITVSPVKDTQILKVSVQNTDPQLAMQIANTLVAEFTSEIIRITKADNVAVVDYAKVPQNPIKPNKIMNTAIAAILGEMLVLLIIFVMEYLDNTLKSEKDIENYLGISVIGTIPNFNQGGKKKMARFSVLGNQRSPITEAYRKIAANIQYANIDDNIKTVMITSTMSNEGKTTTISNIATVMADVNKKVLVLDLDLRKPSIHKQFNISNKKGLTELLLDKGDYKDYISNISDKLDVMTSGKIPANPSQIINSNALKDLIEHLSQQYDYIFIDTPPVALVSDPITIATYADAVVLTIAHSETEKEAVKKTVDSLKSVNANIIGTMLNKVPISKSNKYYYNYYYN